MKNTSKIIKDAMKDINKTKYKISEEDSQLISFFSIELLVASYMGNFDMKKRLREEIIYRGYNLDGTKG